MSAATARPHDDRIDAVSLAVSMMGKKKELGLCVMSKFVDRLLNFICNNFLDNTSSMSVESLLRNFYEHTAGRHC